LSGRSPTWPERRAAPTIGTIGLKIELDQISTGLAKHLKLQRTLEFAWRGMMVE
jgi:hypothetical protein